MSRIARDAETILTVRDLSVAFEGRHGTTRAVDGVSFHIRRGEILCIVGESGSGKSVTALAVLRLVELGGGRIERGEILFSDQRDAAPIDLARTDKETLRALRGSRIAMVFQEPMSSLNPAHTVGAQICEVIRRHEHHGHGEARRRAIALLDRVRLPEASRRFDAFPHELSGGMQQRVMIAMALACKPALLIADEPTTALDVTIQAEILELIAELRAETGMSVLFITHDMGVVAEMADRVAVMHHGRVVEDGDVGPLLSAPIHPYTKALVSAVIVSGAGKAPASPRAPGPCAAVSEPGALANDATPLLQVRDLVTEFPLKAGGLGRHRARFRAVDTVSLDLFAGETLAIVGESGSGKSTLGKSILRLVEPTAGAVRLNGTDVLGLPRPDLLRIRRHMQMVFQDPFGSLNPRRTAFAQIAEPLVVHRAAQGNELADRVEGLARRVGLTSDHLSRYPHAFSGGQRQRLCIARALALSPRLIIADEAVSALDASIRAQVLELMLELQADLGVAYLFISHDIAVVRRISHRVGVMYGGRLVEIGPSEAVCETPAHSYTRTLLDAVPSADPRGDHSRRQRRSSDGATTPAPTDGRINYRAVGKDHSVIDLAVQ